MKILKPLADILWTKQWLPRRIARPFYKRLLRSSPGADYPFTSDFFGLRYQGNLNNNIDYNIFFYGAFEKPLLFFMSDTMNALAPEKTGTFVDIGANVGQHSLYMSRCSATVHSFEPYEPVRRKLLGQIERNQITNIHVHALGLSDTNTRLPFFAPTGNNEGIGSFDESTLEKGNKPIGELELVRGDDFLKTQGLQRIDLMKIDVEGFEKPALEGLRQTLETFRPVLVCEISYGKPMSFASTQELLEKIPQNYRLFTFDKRKADGSKARRRDAHARLSGLYKVIDYERMLPAGQDDVIACPVEKIGLLPGLTRPAGRNV